MIYYGTKKRKAVAPIYADLHIHSRCSDGSMTPQEAAARCRAANVTLAALADHNTWEGCAAFSAACATLGVRTLPAVELSTNHRGIHIHILAYGFSPTPALSALAAECRRLLLRMSFDLIRLLAERDPRVDYDEYCAFEPQFDRAQGGWAGLHYLRQKGLTDTLEAGLPLYRQYDMDYTAYPFPDTETVCRAVREAGGVPVLAHPGSYYAALSPEALRAELEGLAQAGIGGIECFYPTHTAALTESCLAFCRAHPGFWITPGSDCHGTFCRERNGVEFSVGATRTPLTQVVPG